jgi:acyl-CoA synthetase (AMP-forming)/AMP-acid ligase II
MARQGQSFATAQEVRVVMPPKYDGDEVLVDVPKDSKSIGEIVTRGNIVMREVSRVVLPTRMQRDIDAVQYYRDPEATRKAFRGGYFNTGDLAVMHPDGAIAIVDRSKDIIISGGEVNKIIESPRCSRTHTFVPPLRIPLVLLSNKVGMHMVRSLQRLTVFAELASHPHILARSHPKWGERPMAFVILHKRHAKAWHGKHKEFVQDLKRHAKNRLPGFACPEWVQIVEDLPVSFTKTTETIPMFMSSSSPQKTSTGKILKTDLRKMGAKL